jgi:hypothetical protein
MAVMAVAFLILRAPAVVALEAGTSGLLLILHSLVAGALRAGTSGLFLAYFHSLRTA